METPTRATKTDTPNANRWPNEHQRGGGVAPRESPDTARAGAVLNGPRGGARGGGGGAAVHEQQVSNDLFEGALDTKMFTGCSILRKPAGRTPRHEGCCRVLRRPAGIALDAALRDIDVLYDDLPRDKATNTAVVGFLSRARLPST